MQASDVMTEDVETVTPEDDVGEVLTRHGRAEFSGFPVVDQEGAVVGVVTEHDLVGLFQPGDRTLWIPVGFPPFLETLTYAVDLSWDELDLGLDIARNAGKPVRTVMTEDVITVGPTEGIDRLAELLTDDERDVNRLPVVSISPPRSLAPGRSGGRRRPWPREGAGPARAGRRR